MVEIIKKLSHPEILAIICYLLILLGSFLPWGTLESIAGEYITYGYECDGIITIFFSVVGLGSIYYCHSKNWWLFSATVMFFLSIFSLWLIINKFLTIGEIYDNLGSGMYGSFGSGIYLALFSSIGVFISSLWLFSIIGKLKKQKELKKEEPRKIDDAINILRERYAKGEITEEEYEKMKKQLED